MLRLVTALIVASTLIPSVAHASVEWDRKISDIHIVHPPGTPPGIYRATVTLDLLYGELAPMPSNLDMDITCSINGMPFAVEGVGVSVLLDVNQCAFTCPSTICRQLSVTAIGTGVALAINAFCYHPPGSTYGCNCWMTGFQMDFTVPLPLNPGDVLTFTATERPGSLPEVDTSDDSFSMHVWEQAPGVEFCFGEGPLAACPCGNNGVIGNGCANSVNVAGANLIATGNGSVSADTVVLSGSGMPNSTVLYFQGTSQINAGAGSTFGDGLRCAGGSVTRLGSKINAAGASQYPLGTDLAVSVKGGVPAPGGTRTYQGWYRNAAVYCTSATFNLTNGVSLAWQP